MHKVHPYLTYRHYPAIYGRHHHAQLQAIRHDHLLLEQFQLEEMDRNYREREAEENVELYQNEIRTHQRRILEGELRAQLTGEMEYLRFKKEVMDQEIRREQLLRQIQVDRRLLFKKQPYYDTIEYSSQQNTHRKDSRAQPITYSKTKKSNTGKKKKKKSVSAHRGYKESLIQHYENQSFNTARKSKNNGQVKQARTRRRSSLSGMRGQSKKKNDDNVSFQRYHSIQVKQPNRQDRRVSFSLDKRNHSPSLAFQNKKINASLRESQGGLSSSLTERGNKRIQNRLNVSQVTYKDSQWKNIKHELQHLFNTYEAQIKQRRALKAKFNNDPRVIQKHNLTVQVK